MENAGRILAWHVRDVGNGEAIIVAGNGGNGGGGLACARHLANRGIPVQVVLDRPAAELSGDAAHQYTFSTKWDSFSPPASIRSQTPATRRYSSTH
ncbi:NAD(P)H-hydrate epimerase [Haloferax sp. ATB1]|uniref:NAD(P)H-hydrate epimerase n=1 Tax=Haloferax sp. ATB1 TaxID=1508454 RepID=UPI00240F7C2D|nr:NAD(P)H-hydrate epimerase [Haloferax sp. ATB1]